MFRFCISLLLFCALQQTAFAGDVVLEPMTIRDGLESQISFDYPLADSTAIFRSKYFKEKQTLAEKAGLDLRKKMSKTGTSAFNKKNGNFFMLFYNLAQAPTCKRNYLVQRVKLTKSYFDKDGKRYKRTTDYLVEVMKIKGKSLKRADEHYRSYSLNEAHRRMVDIRAEIGCGIVRGEAEGVKWPYSRRRLYERVQDYSQTPGTYDDVVFDFSQKYSFGVEFTRNGIQQIKWPYFVK